MPRSAAMPCASLLPAPAPGLADNAGCVTTAWKLIGANHKVCVDARPQGAGRHVSRQPGQDRGRIRPARSCAGSFAVLAPLPPDRAERAAAHIAREETVFSEDTSIQLEETRVARM